MGHWGMGMTQNDEFCEVYEKFMQEYNQGASVSCIRANILSKYHKEFDDDDGIMHDVYFSLAKAEWMCCEQSPEVLSVVKQIIDSDANIAFLRELGATEKDLILRKKKLQSFWQSLQTPRAKPRLRRVDPMDREKELPPVEVGECYAYKHENGFRVVIVLDRYQMPGWKEQLLCCILKPTFSKADIVDMDFLSQDIGSIDGYVGIEFLSKSSIRKIGEISVSANLKNQLFGKEALLIGSKKNFKKDLSSAPSLSLAELLKVK